VFIPLHDTNPLKRIRYQYVTVALIALNVAIYVIFVSGWVVPPNEDEVASFAVIPAKLLAGGASGEMIFATGVDMPERFTLVTYMFLHGSWIHLLGNMLFLWVFGDNIEDAMGHWRFVMFYLMCGIFAALLHSWMNPGSEIPLVGASGAVAGACRRRNPADCAATKPLAENGVGFSVQSGQFKPPRHQWHRLDQDRPHDLRRLPGHPRLPA
jgi:membrane associated rhomboid family serine protease